MLDSATLSQLLGRTVGFGVVIAASAVNAHAAAGADPPAVTAQQDLVPHLAVAGPDRLECATAMTQVSRDRADATSAFGVHAAHELTLVSWVRLADRLRRSQQMST